MAFGTKRPSANSWFGGLGSFAEPGEQPPGFWLHLNSAVLLVGMVAGVLVVTRSGETAAASRALGIMLAGCALLSTVLVLRGMASARLPGAIFGLVVFITLSGLPGVFLKQDEMGPSLAFFLALILRNYVCFVAIPLSRDAQRGRAERVFVWWTFVGCMVVVAGTWLLALRTGASFSSETQLGSEDGDLWLNNNSTGFYCAFAALLCLIAKGVPRLIRLPAAGFAVYCLLLSQSRTSIAALVICSLLYLAIQGSRTWIAAVGVMLVLPFAGSVSDQLEQAASKYPQLDSLVDKFARSDYRTNEANRTRLDVVTSGLEKWSESPLIGFGYEADGTRFENGYLSMACESGVIGLTAYLVLLAVVTVRSVRLLRGRNNPRGREIGVYLFCTTAFLTVHALGERTHGFTIGLCASNLWSLMIVLSYVEYRPVRVWQTARARQRELISQIG